MPKSSNRKHETRRANRDRRQRLEDMRKQQRSAERRKTYIFVGSAIVLAVALILGATIPFILRDRANAAKLKAGYQTSPTAAEKAAGCLGVHNDPLSPAAVHVPNAAIDYSKEKYGDTRGGTPPLPPSGGRHNPVPLNDQDRFYPLSGQPRPERAVHNLEHGYVVVWYDAKLPAADVTKLQALAKNGSLSRLLVVGWWQGDLPGNTHVVLTSWGRTDRCTSVSDTVVSKFYADHLNDPKLAPEATAGVLNGAQFPGNDLNTTPTGQPGASVTPSPAASGSATPSKK